MISNEGEVPGGRGAGCVLSRGTCAPRTEGPGFCSRRHDKTEAKKGALDSPELFLRKDTDPAFRASASRSIPMTPAAASHAPVFSQEPNIICISGLFLASLWCGRTPPGMALALIGSGCDGEARSQVHILSPPPSPSTGQQVPHPLDLLSPGLSKTPRKPSGSAASTYLALALQEGGLCTEADSWAPVWGPPLVAASQDKGTTGKREARPTPFRSGDPGPAPGSKTRVFKTVCREGLQMGLKTNPNGPEDCARRELPSRVLQGSRPSALGSMGRKWGVAGQCSRTNPASGRVTGDRQQIVARRVQRSDRVPRDHQRAFSPHGTQSA
ncbi:uncharacterized protein LOC104848817 isoform X1 [Fukomys damarensis]|uniref:uncharacterized protein LOC104848817 isoform X1 n=1 Tax=Fukomys damarensis TaxID=885580 RepID=UPI000540157B|nr:uncharacterized protein LOC104848817 isoform X1 [Fukomys damarensis]